MRLTKGDCDAKKYHVGDSDESSFTARFKLHEERTYGYAVSIT